MPSSISWSGRGGTGARWDGSDAWVSGGWDALSGGIRMRLQERKARGRGHATQSHLHQRGLGRCSERYCGMSA